MYPGIIGHLPLPSLPLSFYYPLRVLPKYLLISKQISNLYLAVILILQYFK